MMCRGVSRGSCGVALIKVHNYVSLRNGKNVFAALDKKVEMC